MNGNFRKGEGPERAQLRILQMVASDMQIYHV
jgi:hypothetical protein